MKLLYFIAVAAAYRIPAGLPDGTYVASYDSLGNTVSRRISDNEIVGVEPPSLVKPANTTLEERASPTTHRLFCGCGFTLDHGNCDAAVQGLKNQLGGGSKVDPATYTVASGYGSGQAVVAFACNEADQPYVVSANDVGDAASHVTQSCGWYIAGTYRTSNFYTGIGTEAVSVGYMRYSNGLDICANSDTSHSQSC